MKKEVKLGIFLFFLTAGFLIFSSISFSDENDSSFFNDSSINVSLDDSIINQTIPFVDNLTNATTDSNSTMNGPEDNEESDKKDNEKPKKGFLIKEEHPNRRYVLKEDIKVDAKEVPQEGKKEVLIGEESGFAAKMDIDFSSDVNLSDISMGIDKAARKSFIHNYKNFSSISNVSLLIPRVKNTGSVYVCPNAASIDEINVNCLGKVELIVNQAINGMHASEISINSENYYEVSGILGTGGAENSNTKLNISDDTDIDHGSKRIFTNEDISFYANFSDKSTGAAISGAGASCQIRSNTSTDWSGFSSMQYDYSSKFYNHTTYFSGANGTWFFNVECDATALGYEIISLNDTFNISYSHWHIFYGNITGNMSLGTRENNMYKWEVRNTGNVYAIDTDSRIMWNNLQAIGRNSNGQAASNDFDDVDVNLYLNDSDNVSYSYLSSGAPHTLRNFSIFSYFIGNVSVDNTTNSSNFYTGILWDMSDDGGGGQFDTSDKEDLVFAANINNKTTGKFGIYDFEIKVPANLKDYKDGRSTIDFYSELR